jgi:hypothetical protein
LATANYTVTIGICTTSTYCDVLENSILTTLVGSCVASLTSPTSIICSNVNTIGITNNIIAARVWLSSASSGIIATSQAQPIVNDTTFGTYTIQLNTPTTSAAGVVTQTITTVASAASSSPYTNAFSEAATPQLLANINGNGPLIGFQDSATATVFKTMTDYKGTGLTFTVTGDQYKLLGGVYGQTSGSAASYYIYLVT